MIGKEETTHRSKDAEQDQERGRHGKADGGRAEGRNLRQPKRRGMAVEGLSRASSSPTHCINVILNVMIFSGFIGQATEKTSPPSGQLPPHIRRHTRR